jgi:hypothetical protein
MSPAAYATFLLYALCFGVLSLHLREIAASQLHNLSAAESWFRQSASPIAAFAWRVPALCRISEVVFLLMLGLRFGWQSALLMFAGGLVTCLTVGGLLALIKPLSERSVGLQLALGLAGSFSYPLTLLFGIAAWATAFII